jgi:hypothetical protein
MLSDRNVHHLAERSVLILRPEANSCCQHTCEISVTASSWFKRRKLGDMIDGRYNGIATVVQLAFVVMIRGLLRPHVLSQTRRMQ